MFLIVYEKIENLYMHRPTEIDKYAMCNVWQHKNKAKFGKILDVAKACITNSTYI